ncbi:MAG: hypothetical protein IIA72_02175 [Proteobacteria bacterium]|nr:hypothetical protein [Pseudomonadota bacterium]
MTTLQDSVEAYAKVIAAANVAANVNVTSMGIGAVEETALHEVPYTTGYEFYTTGYEFSGMESALVIAVGLFEHALLSMEPSEHTGSAWAALQGEIPSEGISPLVSPFDLLDERREDQEKVRDLVSYIRSSRRVSFARKLAGRLEILNEVAEEETFGQAGLSPESLRMFIKFLELASEFKYPGVVLSPAGNVRVQWRAASNKLFVAEFYPDGEVRFVIFRPDSSRLDRTSRFSGITSVESLLSEVEPHGVLEWAGR